MLSGRSIAYRAIALLSTVVTLGCVYLFIVRPVLDTTNRAIDQAGQSFEQFGPSIQKAAEISPEARQAIRSAQRLQREQIQASEASVAESRRLLDCMRRANGDVDELSRCSAKYDPASP
ncbi:hypothetical protein HJD18_16115 [Thermoleophilia bacterium SCSIO 60948]|nr:hypothetical protein HJD18_16115 [Thermoleophilia bacterium SCSIO 60948]